MAVIKSPNNDGPAKVYMCQLITGRPSNKLSDFFNKLKS